MKISRTEMMVLKACRDLPKNDYGNVHDDEIAQATALEQGDVQVALGCLGGDDLVTRVPLTTGKYAAQITDRGLLELRQLSPHLDGSKGEPRTPVPIKVVPKGLRSFDAEDKDFFLDLLPGPRRADGLPQGIHFWKTRIEEPDPEKTFGVGVVFGPSGCGKSSLVKAGLLPRLAEFVIPVYLEATADDTETRLLKGLRRNIPDLPGDLDLRETFRALLANQGSSPQKKVLIVLDQFEQWLHTKKAEENPALAQALGECDGARVQTIVLVRDDFWMALTRFMGELGIALRQWENFAAVDLFDVRHARKVLTCFGQAFGALPDRLDDLTKDQNEFLEQAVNGLAQDGRIISVRLALFAEMVKSKPWTPATLKAVGGTAGVGVTFLEETFSSTALRRHQKGAQGVLKSLLPESGTDIKGHMRSHGELLEVSGYGARPQEFRDLLRILDSEVRLITPTDPAGNDGEDREEAAAPGGEYYQLTHDYLVPSLREWLTRKQKETRRGRAELRLAERAALWNDKPENRFLPSAWEWFRIRLLTRKKDWNDPQRRMMKRAGRVHQSRSLGLALLIALLTWGASEGIESLRASSLVEALVSAETSDMPRLVERLTGHRRWANPRLVRLVQASKDDSKVRLHASLALVPVDPSQIDYLAKRVLTASPTELPVIWIILTGHHFAPVKRFWDVLDDPKADPDQRFRAACVLANSDAEGTEKRWDAVVPFVTDRLIASVHKNPSHYAPLIEILRPVRQELLAPLSAIFRDKNRAESDRSLAASILADYVSDQPTVLADLLMDSGEHSFAILFDKLKAHREEAVALLEAELKKKPVTGETADAKNKRDRRQGRAAVALLRLGQTEKVWTLLKHSRDPGVRSEIVNGLKPHGAEFEAIAAKLAGMGTTEEFPVGDPSRMNTILFHPETSMRRALILALGQYDVDMLSSEEREPLVAKLVEAYRDDPDAGIHGAAEWTLRRWKQGKKLEAVHAELMKVKDRGDHRWYMNGQGQTFAVIDGPVEFSMGSPPTDPERFDDELRHRERVPRRFVIAAREVSVEQYQAFVKENVDHAHHDRYSPDPDCPMNDVSWYHAAAYCNWLSRTEGLPECYEPNDQGKYAEGMRIKADALKLSGYRLPTEAEWEYACRAGAETSRYYGTSVELLGSYSGYVTNSQDRTRPCGSLLPNDLGLFDMLGNVYEWCQDSYKPYPQGNDDDKTDNTNLLSVILDKDPRLLRGGAFFYPAGIVRSPNRYRIVPWYHDFDSGFRPARTYP
jgi:formylglycine-generating enzyme required for sulfatase activity